MVKCAYELGFFFQYVIFIVFEVFSHKVGELLFGHKFIKWNKII